MGFDKHVHHHSEDTEQLVLSPPKPSTLHWSQPLFLPQPLAAADLFSILIVLSFPECHTSGTNHALCGLVSPSSFTLHNAFEIQPRFCMYQ